MNKTPQLLAIAAAGVSLLTPRLASADPNVTVDNAWNQNASLIWGTAANWTPASVAGGPDGIGLYVTATNNLSGSSKTITLFNTGDAGTAAKTIGRLDIGDPDGSHGFTIAAGTGSGVLDFDGNGGAAILNQIAGSGANTISAPITLSTSLNIGNASSTTLLLSGSISGGNSITINSAGSGAVNLGSSASTFSGGVTLTSGLLYLGAGSTGAPVTSGPLGTGTVSLNGGAISSSSSSVRVIGNSVTLGGSVTIGQTSGGTGQIQLTGTTTLTGNRTITTDAGLLYGTGGVITDGVSSFSLTKNGLGTLSLTVGGTSAYAFDGGLNIDAGTLSLGQNLSITAGAGAVTFANNTNLSVANSTLTNNVVLNGSLNYNTATGGNLVNILSGTVSGVGGIVANFNSGVPNNGTLVLSGVGNSFSGGVTVNNNSAVAVVRVAANTTGALGSGVLTLNNATQAVIGGTIQSNMNLISGTTTANQDVDGIVGSATTSVIGNSNVAGGSRITISPASGTNTFNGVIGGTNSNGNNLSIVKTGNGTQVFGGVNTYTGSTAVTAGTLVIASGGSLSASSAVSVSSGGILAGLGNVNGTVTVNNGGILSPGNSPGLQNYGGLVLNDGGNYNWQILDATGVAGTGFDTINLTGTLNLAGLTGATDYNINLWSLSSTGPDVNGNAANFNNAVNQSWTLVTTSNVITGFDASEFTVNVGANAGAAGFSNALGGGTFSVALSGDSTDLLLIYTAVPEPSTCLLFGLGASTFLFFRRRKR